MHFGDSRGAQSANRLYILTPARRWIFPVLFLTQSVACRRLFYLVIAAVLTFYLSICYNAMLSNAVLPRPVLHLSA